MEDQSMIGQMGMFENDSNNSFLEDLTGGPVGMSGGGDQAMMSHSGMPSGSMANNMQPGIGVPQGPQQGAWNQQPAQKPHHYGNNYGMYSGMGDGMASQSNMPMNAQGMMSPGSQYGTSPATSPHQTPQQQQGGYPFMNQSPMPPQPRQNQPQSGHIWSANSQQPSRYGQPRAASFTGQDYPMAGNQSGYPGPQQGQPGYGVQAQIGSPPPAGACMPVQMSNTNSMNPMGQMPSQPRQMNQYSMQGANVHQMQAGASGNLRPPYNQVGAPGMSPAQRMNSASMQMNGGRMAYYPGASAPRYPQESPAPQQANYPYPGGSSQSGPAPAQHIMPTQASSTQMAPVRPPVGPAQRMPGPGVSRGQNFMPTPNYMASSGQAGMGMGNAAPSTIPPGGNMPQQLAVEINNLQQQISQMYNMPQSPQTQQQMLDLQERLRSLQTQQQLMSQRQGSSMPQAPRQPTPNSMMPHGPPQLSPMQTLPSQVPGAPVPTSQPSPMMGLPTTPTTTTLPHNSSPSSLVSASQLSSSEADLTLPTLSQPLLEVNSASAGTPMSQDALDSKDELNTPATSPLNLDELGMNEEKPAGAQNKANRIIQEAIAKAQAEGRPVPAIVSPSEEGEAKIDGKSPKKGVKKERKKKEPKEPKEPKPKKPKKPREPKEPKEPKPKKSPPKKKKKKVDETGEEVDGEMVEGVEVEESEEQKEVKKKVKTPARPRPKKKRTIPTFLKNKKKKRRHSSEDEIRMTPPPSGDEDESGIQKRRSARNTKRKKYLDDVDLELSEDEEGDKKRVRLEAGYSEDSQPLTAANMEEVYTEDGQIVEKIMHSRVVKRKLVQLVEEKPVEDKENEVTPPNAETTPTENDKNPEQNDSVDVTGTETKTDNVDNSTTNETPAETKTSEETTGESHVTQSTIHEQSVVKSEGPLHEKTTLDATDEFIEEEEFFVKYKNFSYLHCEWRTAEELERGDRRVHQKIKRFKMKRAQAGSVFLEMDEDELFNPSYVEVDRVLDVSRTTDPLSGDPITHYLVKWRGLAYEESTWELSVDVNKSKIEAFEKYRVCPDEEERKVVARPAASAWQKMEESPVYNNGNCLREYQLEGVSWLSFSWYNRQNCILADEMGLGKTIQSITFLKSVFDYGIRGPFLVIAPLSTIPNWQREFDLWVDMNVIVYHGTTPSRNMLQDYEMYYKDENGKRIPDAYKFHTLITTYEIIISDMEELSEIEWRVTIIDEAHRLKNRNCKLLEGLRCFDLEHRVLLTGTPLQNNVDELFSLLNFLEPKQFSSSETFLAEFGKLQTDTQVEKLKALLKPMMLRRLKEDVEKNLAQKEETIIEVELTNLQKKYYRAILEKNFTFLAKGSTSTNIPNLMNTMMELRKCCNHPYLLNGAEDNILEEVRGSAQPTELHSKLAHSLVASSGKLVLIDKLLPKLKAGDHKVLIFSQMIRVLDILEDYLIANRYQYERLDGRIRGQLRQEAIDRFCRPDSDRFVFLLCTRAGGLGINLTAADTVIIYDSDWNPQNDLQAQARCHRIGQEKLVKVYRLITRNTYEREMFDKASMKLGLDKAVLQSMGPKELGNNQMSKSEIEELLKKGAYGALMEEDSTGEKFCEENIDDILSRRTQVIQIDSGVKGSTFSKASFNTSDTRSDINLDDPNFWQKWARHADVDTEDRTKKNLIMEMPRQRKQTSRYGNQDMIDNMSELESSDSDEGTGGRGLRSMRRGKKGRRGEDSDGEEGEGYYSRSDCFKVEKHLLVFGWGRWQDIMSRARFKRVLEESDIILITRAMLLYSLRHYAGDERIKQFIYDLVTPTEDGQEKDHTNHSGLSAPVPRGRKGKKNREKTGPKDGGFEETLEKLNFDPETIIMDEGYKKHLKRHANKVLLRVRLLYYLKQEVIGNQAEKIFAEKPIGDIDIPEPCVDGDPPAFWWDKEADRSLLIGTFKHGYEKYNSMRQDPTLVFLARCGPPDSRALAAEQNDMDDIAIKDDDEEVDMTPVRGRGRGRRKKQLAEYDEDDSDLPGTPGSLPRAPSVPHLTENGKLPFPLASDINTRLRRVITGYQRNHKRAMLKHEQRAKRMERREKCEEILRERERQRVESQQMRWTRREEADFYRVVSTFGVERDRRTGTFLWETFRSISKLERKYDETLTEYFVAFYHMCMRVCRCFKTEQEAIPPNSIQVEPITEERASRCLARIDLLNKIREVILWHPKLSERLRICQHSPELPEWWIPGEHDKELLIGAAKHGLARTDYHILYDPKLTFREVARVRLAQYGEKAVMSSPATPNTPGTHDMPDIVSSKPEPVPKLEGKVDQTPPQLTKAHDIESSQDGALNLCKKEVTKAPPSPVKAEEAKVKSEVKEEDEMSEPIDLHKEPKTEDGKEAVTDAVVKEELVVKEESVVKREELVAKEEPVVKREESVAKEEPVVKGEELVAKKEEPVVVSEADKSELGVDHLAAVGGGIETATEEETEGEECSLPSLKKEELTRPHPPGDDTPQRHPNDEGDEDYDMTGNEQALLGQAWAHPAVQWPKDRVVFQRLENICYCVEKGEWPYTATIRRFFPSVKDSGGSDSRSSTPVAPTSITPKSGTPVPTSMDYTLGSEGDGLKMTFHRKRRRRTKAEIEAERAARLREMIGGSDAESESNLSSTQTSEVGEAGHMRGDASPLVTRRDEDSLLKDGDLDQHHHRRHRRTKMDRFLDVDIAAMASASPMSKQFIANSPQNPSTPPQASSSSGAFSLEPDTRVAVIRMTDGKRLSGGEAPMLKDLQRWLEDNPGYIIDRPVGEDDVQTELEQAMGHRRGRRRRLDPTKLEVDSITGEENVSVVNRETGKRITGAKAPPLRFLKEWLQRNPGFDVDPKWAHIVKAKANLPQSLKSRVLVPHGRGRRPSNMVPSSSTPPSSSSAIPDFYSSSSSLASLGAMASYQKQLADLQQTMNPYMSSLAAINPMYASMLASYGLIPGVETPTEKAPQEEKEKRRSSRLRDESEDKTSPSKSSASSAVAGAADSSAAAAAALAANPSLQYLYGGYNPLLLSQLYAQSMAGFPSSYANLAAAAAAQQNMLNGMSTVPSAQDSEEEVPKRTKSPKAESSKVSDEQPQDLTKPQDLTVKPKSSSSPRNRKVVEGMGGVGLPEDLSVKKAPSDTRLNDAASRDVDTPPTGDELQQSGDSRWGEVSGDDSVTGGEGMSSPLKKNTVSKRKKGVKSKLEAVVAAISAKAQQAREEEINSDDPKS